VLSLVSAREVRKVAARDLANAIASGSDGGTTVSATLVACRLAGIQILATGGIGGVHRGWQSQPDVSEDLHELARSRVCVVSSGAKSVLDIAATLEVLETLGIPTLGWRTHQFPVFYSAGTLPVSQRADELQFVTRVLRTRWNLLDQDGGVLLANPVPAADALSAAELERIVDEAQAEAKPRGIFGSALTPFLLDRVAHKTRGRSVQANLALLKSNATLAGELSVQWAGDNSSE
jgi:pseudouridine-5'-phosphate glycosidase